MTFIRPKPKSPKLGLREPAVLRSDGHLKYIRTKVACIVTGCNARQIEPAHVRLGLPCGEQAGVAQKPADNWCVPLCREHHAEQHQHGEKSFATKYGLNLVKLALAYASKSPDQSIRDKAEQLRSVI